MDQAKIEFLKTTMPHQYFSLIDEEDFDTHFHLINKAVLGENRDRIFHFKGDIEDFYVHRFCREKLQSTLLKVSARVKGNVCVYRVFANRSKDFVLSAIYKSLAFSSRISEFDIPTK